MTISFTPNLKKLRQDIETEVAANYLQRSKVAGGTTAQVLKKASNADEAMVWGNASDVNVIVESTHEVITLTAGQTVVNFATITTEGAAFYRAGVRLMPDQYTVNSMTRITLATSYAEGTKIMGVMNEPQASDFPEFGVVPMSRLDGEGVLAISPADGRYITLSGTGAANFTITGFGIDCPAGHEITLTIPRTIGNTGGVANSLGNYVQFAHTASGDGLDMAINARQSGASTLYTYQAYPNANDVVGNLCALYEVLNFLHVGSGRWKLAGMPQSFRSYIGGVESEELGRSADGKQELSARRISASGLTTLQGAGIYGTGPNIWTFAAKFAESPSVTVIEMSGVGGCWGAKASVSLPVQSAAYPWQLMRFAPAGDLPIAGLTATGSWKPNV